MMPPSTREIMRSVGSKYAVVVGISKKAREEAANKEAGEKEERLADLVNHTVEELIEKKVVLHHAEPEENLVQDAETVQEDEQEPVSEEEKAEVSEEDTLEADEEE